VHQQVVALRPVGILVLRRDVPHAGQSLEEGRLAAEAERVVQVGDGEEPLDLVLLGQVQVDQQHVLQEAGRLQLLVLRHGHPGRLEARLRLQNGGVQVFAVVGDGLSVPLAHLVRGQAVLQLDGADDLGGAAMGRMCDFGARILNYSYAKPRFQQCRSFCNSRSDHYSSSPSL
jgi:hypothetical protein